MAKFTSYDQGTPSYIELVTPDQKAAQAFYGPLLGWSFDSADMPDGSVYVQSKIEGDTVAGISGQMPGLEGHPAFWGVYLTVDDIDAAAAAVKGAGGEVEAEPFDVMTFGRMAAIKDPTGARVNLWQAGESIGSERANEPGTLVWNELVSPDVPKALAFYEQALGMAAAEQDMGGSSYFVVKNASGNDVGGAMGPMMEGIPPHWNLYFQVADVDATIAAAEAAGGKAIAPAFDVPGVGRLGFIQDPQGAMFNVMSPSAAA